MGNRTLMSNGSQTSYESNRLNQYSKVAGVNYTYDVNGNLTSDGSCTYYYDYENRLTRAYYPPYNAYYKYDFSGRRGKRQIGGPSTVTKFTYDGDQIIADYNYFGGLQRKYVYGPGIDEPICMTSGTSTYYYHFDGLGSVVALSNGNCQIVEKYSYDVFGRPTIRDANNSVVSVSSVANRFMFTGREYGWETGNYYYRARYYSPKLGRFLQTDLIGYTGGLNLYTYCRNSPINWVDPSGLMGVGIGFGGSGGDLAGATMGVQIVIDNHGNFGIFIHGGGGGYVGAGGSGGIDISVFSGEVHNLNGVFSSTGGSFTPGVGGTFGGEYHYGGWNGEIGGTVHIGLGGGTPEGHHFIEMGTVVKPTDILTPKIIVDYWTGVGQSAWNMLKKAFSSDKVSEPFDPFEPVRGIPDPVDV